MDGDYEDECCSWSLSIDTFQSSIRPSLLPVSRFTFNFEFCVELATFDCPIQDIGRATAQQQPTTTTLFFRGVSFNDDSFRYYDIRQALDEVLTMLPVPDEERPDVVTCALDHACHLFYGQQLDILNSTTFDFGMKLRMERDRLLFPMEEAADDDQLSFSPSNSGVSSLFRP